VGDAGLPQLAALERLRHLDVSRSGVTARGLATLARLPQLETLRVWGTDLREASAAILAAFPRLRALDVARTGIPPRALLGCLGLELLCVGGNPIEDDELLALAALPRLRVLGVSRTELGEAGLARFRERVGDRVEVLTNRDPAWD
jgi:hypothetical protein